MSFAAKRQTVMFFGVSLQFSDSLFPVSCNCNTATVILGTPSGFVVPTQKNDSVHPGKPFP